MSKSSQGLFGSSPHDNGWHIAIYMVGIITCSEVFLCGLVGGVRSPSSFRDVWGMCRLSSELDGSMGSRRSTLTREQRWAALIHVALFTDCDAVIALISKDLPLPGMQGTDHPSWTPATIFVASDHLHHLLVKNGMRRDKAPGTRGICLGPRCQSILLLVLYHSDCLL